ncbi:MAG: AsmA family protein [Gammaproteobacteria bacterium]|nr:AsmA family protein [Gammaproteobacteria bacterium]
MSRLVKLTGWLVAAFVALFVLGAIAFFLFFDANDFREEIAQAAENATGREVTIEGDVGLTFFPWLAVDIGRASLGNAAGFGEQPFAKIERARMSVRLLPLLLRQQIVVGSVDVAGLELNLAENRQGVSNWDDLLAGESSQAGADKKPGDAAVDVAGVEFSDATVSYHDAVSGSRYTLTNAGMRIGPVTGTAQNLLVKGFSLDGTLDGVGAMPTELSISTKSIGINTVDQLITMQPLELGALGMEINAEVQPFSYEGDVQPSAAIKVDAFSPRSLMTVFGTEPPETADPVALTRLIIEARAALKAETIDLTDVSIKLDDTTLRGSLTVPRSSSGAYRFDLAADRIELARYMEPASETATGKAGESVPVDIPTDLIRALNARGNLRVAAATLGDMLFEDVVLGLNAGKGDLRLNPVTAQLFGGTYSGDVRINAAGDTPALSVDEKIDGVDLGNLVGAMFGKENVTGGISGGFKLAGRGQDLAAIQRSLAGNMSFQLKDGAYEGTDIWYELRRARALLKRETPPTAALPARTRFSAVTATGVVRDGVMQNDDLFAEMPFMQLRGRGSVDLAAATLDYNLTARVLERPEALAGVSEAELDDFTEAVIPLKITGSLASPSVKPDVEGLVRQRVEQELKDRVFDKLLGGDKKKEAAPAPAEGTAEDVPAEGEPEEKSAEEMLEDKLKDKLKDLFD